MVRVLIIICLMMGVLAFSLPLHAQTPATMTIVSPAPGEVIEGDVVQVLLQVSSELKLGENARVHLWLDVLERTSDNAVASREPSYIFNNVRSGLHTLHAEVVRQDGSSFDQKMEAKVEFETFKEELKREPRRGEDRGGAPPEPDGGLFLPRGKSSNTIFTIVLVVIGAAILWFVFGRQDKK